MGSGPASAFLMTSSGIRLGGGACSLVCTLGTSGLLGTPGFADLSSSFSQTVSQSFSVCDTFLARELKETNAELPSFFWSRVPALSCKQ